MSLYVHKQINELSGFIFTEISTFNWMEASLNNNLMLHTENHTCKTVGRRSLCIKKHLLVHVNVKCVVYE